MRSKLPPLFPCIVLTMLSACTSVNHDFANSRDAEIVVVDGLRWDVNVREEDNAIWIQNASFIASLATGPTRPDSKFMKVARMYVPAGCKIVSLGAVQTNSREALYEC